MSLFLLTLFLTVALACAWLLRPVRVVSIGYRAARDPTAWHTERQVQGWFAPLALCTAISFVGCAAGQSQSTRETLTTAYSWLRRACGVVVGLPEPARSSSGSP